MAEESLDDIDLDEDLFDFEPVALSQSDLEDEDADLDAIFATFHAQDEAESKTPAAENVVSPPSAQVIGLGQPTATAPTLAPAPTPAAQPALAAPAPATIAASGAPSPAPAQAPAYAPPPPPAVAPAVAPQPATRPVAVDEAAQPAARPAVAPGLSRGQALLASLRGENGTFARTVLWILLAAISLNGLVALVLVNSTQGLKSEMLDLSRGMEQTIRDIRSDYWSQRSQIEESSTPLVAPDPENHPAFDRALEEIESGDCARARQRLYALLAVVDRMEPSVRRRVEARASYLIGHAWHLEALERLKTDAEASAAAGTPSEALAPEGGR